MCKATSSNNSISSHPLREQQSEINTEDKTTTTMIVANNDVSLDESLDDSITCQWLPTEDNKTEGDEDKPATSSPEEEQDGNFIFRAFNSLASLPGRNRAGSEDSLPIVVNDDEHDECAKEEETSELLPQQLQQEESIITRIISRQPVTSLDTTASKCVLRCLEENMENQSMLYKWATSNMTPTVNYMGRKFQPIYDNDENNTPVSSLPAAPSSKQQEHLPRACSTASSSTTTVGTTTVVDEQNNMSFVARMGLSWSTHSETDEMDLEREECKDYMRDIAHSDTDFAAFKAQLRQQGVKTNLCLDLLYKVAKKKTSQENDDDDDDEPPQRRRCNTSTDSSSLAGNDDLSVGGGIIKSRWTMSHHHHHHVDEDDMDQMNTAAGEKFVGYANDDEDAPSTMIIISRCE